MNKLLIRFASLQEDIMATDIKDTPFVQYSNLIALLDSGLAMRDDDTSSTYYCRVYRVLNQTL